MPSPNPRIQVAASPDLYAQLKTMAKGRGITLSYMVQELCAYALSVDEIKQEYQDICAMYGEVPVQGDKRKRPGVRPWSKQIKAEVFEIKKERGSTPEEEMEMKKWEEQGRVRPVCTYEQQEKLKKMKEEELITVVQYLQQIEVQPIPEGMTREQFQEQRRQELLILLGEQEPKTSNSLTEEQRKAAMKELGIQMKSDAEAAMEKRMDRLEGLIEQLVAAKSV